jgi:hypothetical protein
MSPTGYTARTLDTKEKQVNLMASGEWAIQRTSAKTRRVLHYWATVTRARGVVILRDALWFVFHEPLRHGKSTSLTQKPKSPGGPRGPSARPTGGKPKTG